MLHVLNQESGSEQFYLLLFLLPAMVLRTGTFRARIFREPRLDDHHHVEERLWSSRAQSVAESLLATRLRLSSYTLRTGTVVKALRSASTVQSKYHHY